MARDNPIQHIFLGGLAPKVLNLLILRHKLLQRSITFVVQKQLINELLRSGTQLKVINPLVKHWFKIESATIFYVLWQAMSAIQTYTYKIRSYHTDAAGQLFIHQLLNFLQDAAHNHADGAGFGYKQLGEQDLAWVLSRLTIEIASLPARGDEIKLSTWVKSIRGAISEREFSISLAEQVLVNASSLWFCVSGQTHKPARLPAEYSDLMEIKDSYATSGGTEKVAEANGENKRSEGRKMTAQYSDIDMVDHVNNATYLRWLMDEIPAEYQQNNKIKNISVNYIGESFLDNDVQVFHTIINPTNLLHEVVDTESDKVICRLHSSWK